MLIRKGPLLDFTQVLNGQGVKLVSDFPFSMETNL